ncbi:PTS sugar transporter subunit IIB [Caldifermentibacillus hisashii]|uniref:PTS sugar transporter subunit IIB n=1 Tax=Caldifermentibacillus hisashii TaxID=996558 RepID=UPI0030E927CB
MENLLLTRIDDRLIHGQVMTAWMKVIPAKQILIVDNKVAKDDFMLSVLKMSAPTGVKVEVYSEEKAIEVFNKGLSEPTIMLVKTPLTLKVLVDEGVDIKEINIGGMGLNADRKKLFKNIAASDAEREVLKEFIFKGIDVKIQIIPAEKVIDVKGLL